MKKILFASLVALVLVGCSKDPQEVSATPSTHKVTQQVQQSNAAQSQVPSQSPVAPQQPIVIENKSDSSAATNMALGMMLGNMMSNSSNGHSNQAYNNLEAERRAVEAERRALEAERRANSYNAGSMASATSTYLPSQTPTAVYRQEPTKVQQQAQVTQSSIIGSKVAEPLKVQETQKNEAPKVVNTPREIVQTDRKPGTFTSGSFTLPKQPKVQETIVVTNAGKSSSDFNKQSSAGFSTNKSVARSQSSFTSTKRK